MERQKQERQKQERQKQHNKQNQNDQAQNMEFGEEFNFDQKRQEPNDTKNKERRNHRK